MSEGRGLLHFADLADGEAAIDDDHFAGDVLGRGGEEKDDGAGAVLGLAEATLEDFLFVMGLALRIAVEADAGLGRENEAGGDAVDADVVVGEFHSEAAHHHGDTAFGGVVGGGVDLGLEAIDRAGDDDGAGAFLGGEFLGEGLNGEVVGLEVEIDGAVPTIAGHFEKGGIVAIAGIADEEIEIGVLGEGVGEELLGAGFAEEVAGEVGGAGIRIGILGFDAVANDLGSGGVDRSGNGLTDATAGTGDESSVVVKRKRIRRHDRGS